MQWLLWSRQSDEALLLSPEEVELVIEMLRKKESSEVHLLTYAAPVTRKMLHFNDLKYYAIPPMPEHYQVPIWLRIEVGFFAGRIYFEWDEYEGILNFLGLRHTVSEEPSEPEEGTEVEAAVPETREKSSHGFTPKPVAFLQDWISARRKMQDWSASPMGFIVAGKTLHAHHPFFATPGDTDAEKKKMFFVENTEAKDPEEEAEDDDVFYDADDHVEAGSDGEDWDDRKSADGE